VPMIIRGPGIEEKATSDLVTSHTDLAPTILDLLGIKPRADFDGLAIPVKAVQSLQAKSQWQEHVGVEYWGPAVGLFFINIYDLC
jgi:arylsulfatase A-like enzyme